MKFPLPKIRSRLVPMAIGAALFVALAGLAGLTVMYTGIYSVAAMEQHLPPVHWALEQGMRRSVRYHAAEIRAPRLDDPDLVARGFRCFHDNCVQCHGAPGIAPEDIGKGLMPIPNSLTQTARDWRPEELYWVTKFGIRMAGMPAWGFRLGERDLWATVAFLERLPLLTAEQYRGMIDRVPLGLCERPAERSEGDPERGKVALRQYACHGCHKIPGITGPDVYVGPPLERFAQRTYIAGVLPNNRENLVRWIREPQRISPRTLMPDMGVTEAHARDMVAYLEELE